MPKPILCLPDTALIMIELDWLINNIIFRNFALTFKAFCYILYHIKQQQLQQQQLLYKERIMKIIRVKSFLKPNRFKGKLA